MKAIYAIGSFISRRRFAAVARIGAAAAAALAAVAVLIIAVTPRQACAQVAQLYVRGVKQHIHGVNLPWIANGTSSYGHDIGPNQMNGYGFRYSGTDVDSYFTDIKNMHTNVVRVWLFEGGEGLTFDSSGYVSGVDVTFKNNLNDMITRANAHGLALYLTFVNHDLGTVFGHRTINGVIVKNFLTDGTAQQRYLDNAVLPIVRDCATKIVNSQRVTKSGFFAFDVMNESNYATTGVNSYPAFCTWQQIHDFVYNTAAKVHTYLGSVQISCSTDDASSFTSANFYNRFGGVGLDFYDYHNYADSPNLFDPSDAGPYPAIDRPILLGEYGANNAAAQASATDSFINQASYKGWAGSLAWSYDPNGGTLSIINSVGNWKDAAWKIQWWGLNKFGL